MPANRYDQASRYGVKLDPVGYLIWLLGEPPAVLRYRGWLDTHPALPRRPGTHL